MTDQLGGVTTYTYDALGRRKTVTDAESHVTEYFYSATGSVTKTTIDGHTVSETVYDALGRTVKATDGEGNGVTYTYDSVGNVKTYTDALGNVTKYEYNKNYRTVKVTDALGNSSTTSYDALGRVTQSTDAEGNTTTYTYDAAGNVLTVTDALGNSVTYTYDNRGRTAAATDKLGSVTTYTYDAKGNVTATKDAAGYSTRYTYDALGNLVKSTNRMNESVSYTYDSMSRRIKEKNELNQTREYAYDAAGNLVSVTDGNRHVTTYTYDSLSRLVLEENAEGGIAEYTYDYLGNVSTYTVYGGNNERATTVYTYDAAGNLTKETSPLGYATTYEYDASGNITSRTDENGTETTYEYDALGRLIKREDRDGQVSYTYDKVGNVTSATSGAGTVSFSYDELYRTTKVTNEDGTNTEYTYDAAGNRLSITYPDGKAVTTTYDELGRVLSLTDHDGTGILYTRDAEGRITKESYSDGSTTEYTYNAAGLLTLQKEVTKDNETLRQIVYAYDDAGNLTSENRSGVGIERKDELVRYYYDKADQLVKTNVEGVTTSYTYDKAGNLLSDGESTYTYDIQNRLLTKTNADGTTTYTYDKAGNLTREIAPDGITNYTYNAQNKLVKGEKTNGESSEYIYNALGVRIANTQVRTNKNAGNQNADLKDGSHGTDYMRFLKDGRSTWQRVWESEIGTTVQNDGETVTRHYVVDYLSIANRDIFVTEDGSYTTRYVYDASGRRLSAELDYAPGTKRGEEGENLQSDIAVNIGKVFYRTSILGSTLFALDKNGDVIAHAIYDPWGKPLTETYTDANYSGLENLNNYTGYTWDITLKLYFAQNRFYDASNHRFTQEDAVKDGTNWYVYCGNEPVLQVDPYGLTPYDNLRSVDWNRTLQRKYNGEVYYSIRSIAESISTTGKLQYEPYDKGTNTARFIWGYNGKSVEITYDLNEVPRKQFLWTTVPENGVIISGTAKASYGTYTLSLLYYNKRVYIKKSDLLSIFYENFGEAFPVTGAEPSFQPLQWNSFRLAYRANCYAYALDMQKHINGKAFLTREEEDMAYSDKNYYNKLKCEGYTDEQIAYSLQPGVFSCMELTSAIKQSPSDFYEFCYEDLKANPKIEVMKINRTTTVPEGFYRVCLVAKKYISEYQWDYHWYRQDSDGSWSHKCGEDPATNLDNSGRRIYDPVYADRGRYTEVIGFYAIKKK